MKASEAAKLTNEALQNQKDENTAAAQATLAQIYKEVKIAAQAGYKATNVWTGVLRIAALDMVTKKLKEDGYYLTYSTDRCITDIGSIELKIAWI